MSQDKEVKERFPEEIMLERRFQRGLLSLEMARVLSTTRQANIMESKAVNVFQVRGDPTKVAIKKPEHWFLQTCLLMRPFGSLITRPLDGVQCEASLVHIPLSALLL